jgi:hypothetical protein
VIKRTWHVALGSAIGGAFYLLLIDNSSGPELYVLAGVALGCGVTFTLAREQDFVGARFKFRWLAGVWRLIIDIPRDIAILCWEALAQLVAPKPARGRFRAARYSAVEDSPIDTGRRALTEGFGSVAPNTVVVGVDAERGLLLVHQLRARGEPEDLDVMRLG